MNKALQIPFRFVGFVLIQVLVLNSVQLSGYINPFLYIVFILTLPVEFPKYLGLFLAFILGFTIDIFSGTIGLHIVATLFVAYIRPFLLRLMAPRDGFEFNAIPGIRDMGLGWYLPYISIGVILHHAVLFYTEIFRFSEFFDTLGKVAISSLLTIVLAVLTEYVVQRNKRLEP